MTDFYFARAILAGEMPAPQADTKVLSRLAPFATRRAA